MPREAGVSHQQRPRVTGRTPGHDARRWRVETGIAEAVTFFHLNALSSPILTKVHFDIALTMIADTLYTMLARRLRGFEGRQRAGMRRSPQGCSVGRLTVLYSDLLRG